MSGSTAQGPPAVTEIENEILRQVRSLHYGSVEIQVHADRVVQIERRERVRLDERPRPR